MPDELDPMELLATRVHPVLKSRLDQIRINALSIKGGQPYVSARLSRFAGESKISWEGGSRPDGTRVTGRKHQAHNIPILPRIADKVSQYVFARPPSRDGLSQEIAANMNRSLTCPMTADQIMKRLLTWTYSQGWCWLGVDMPRVPADKQGAISEAEKTALGIRPYFVPYSAAEVVDWQIDDAGNLLWLLTEGSEMSAPSAMAPRSVARVRFLWSPGKVESFALVDEGENEHRKTKAVPNASTDIDFPGVPFVLCGHPSEDPIMWDSLESINRTTLDLESVNRQNFFDRCFPQMVLPASCRDMDAAAGSEQRTEGRFGTASSENVGLLIGMKFPIFCQPGDVIPQYIMPAAADLAAIRAELSGLKAEMMDCVGFMLRKNSAAAESADSKAWDHLDIEQALANTAGELESIERRAVAIANKWDPSFPEYSPDYAKTFDVSDLNADIQSIVNLANVSMPPAMTEITLKKLVGLLRKIGQDDITPEERKRVFAEIAEFAKNAPVSVATGVPPEAGGEGEGDMEDGEEHGATGKMPQGGMDE